MEVTPSSGTRPDRMSTWVQDERPVIAAPAAKAKPKVKYALPGDIAADIRKAFIGTSYMREKMVLTLTRAAEAYDRKRYEAVSYTHLAKGMNLALADVRLLAPALVASLRDGDERPLDSYSSDSLRRVWRAEEFSTYMTQMLHPHPSDEFENGVQVARLRQVIDSRCV